MTRFIGFLISVAVFIYFGVWLAIGLAIYSIYVWLLVVLWNKVLSEILPLPEIGFFGGWIFSFFVDVIGVTTWFIWMASSTA